MSGDNYILKGKIPVLCPDLMTWAKWMGTADRHVKEEYIGDYWISTVFLGIDHGWHSENPILFETMVFNHAVTEPNMFMNREIHPTLDEYTERYSTWEEAERGHDRIVRMVRKSTLVLIEGTKQ